MIIDDKDRALLDLMEINCRASTAELARKLGLSRSTVKDRIQRLERQGVIKAYRVELSEQFTEGDISAHVMIDVDPKLSVGVNKPLQKIAAIKGLYAINGSHDLLAIVRTPSTQALDAALDEIGAVEGVEHTMSSIILSTKFER